MKGGNIEMITYKKEKKEIKSFVNKVPSTKDSPKRIVTKLFGKKK